MMSKTIGLSRSPVQGGDPAPVKFPNDHESRDENLGADLGLGVNTVEEQVSSFVLNKHKFRGTIIFPWLGVSFFGSECLPKSPVALCLLGTAARAVNPIGSNTYRAHCQ